MITEDVLARYHPFNSFSPAQRRSLLNGLEQLKLETGAFLFKRGKELPEAYFLLEGSIDLIDHNFNSQSLAAGTPQAREALNPESVSSVSARATSEVFAFCVNRELLDHCQQLNEARQQGASTVAPAVAEGDIVTPLEDDDEWFNQLLSSPLFAHIPFTQVQQLFTKLRSIPVKAGEKIMQEGERGDYFYVLAKGQALITNALGSVNVTVMPGTPFGEEALLGGTPRNASVTMTRDGIIKRMTEEDFNQLIRGRIIQYLDAKAVEALTEPFTCIDVKMPIEFRVGHYPGSINIPLARLRERLSTLADKRLYLIPDDAEGRAEIAAHLLCQAGFDARIIKNAAAVIYGEA